MGSFSSTFSEETLPNFFGNCWFPLSFFGNCQYVSSLPLPFWLAESDQLISASTQADALSSLRVALAPSPLDTEDLDAKTGGWFQLQDLWELSKRGLQQLLHLR